MKILFGLMFYLMIEYILKYRKIKESDIEKNFLENSSEESYSKRVSDLKQWQSKKQQELNDGGDKENNLESSLITSNCEEQLIESYSNNISSQKIIAVATYKELLALIEELGFDVEELNGVEEHSNIVLDIVKVLDIVGTVPTFLEVKDANYSFILAIDSAVCFSFINIFSVGEKYNDKMVEFMSVALNRNIDKYPIPIHYVFDTPYNDTVLYSFTPFFQYEKENFLNILKIFSTKVKIDVDAWFGINTPLPKFVNEILKQSKNKNIIDAKFS